MVVGTLEDDYKSFSLLRKLCLEGDLELSSVCCDIRADLILSYFSWGGNPITFATISAGKKDEEGWLMCRVKVDAAQPAGGCCCILCKLWLQYRHEHDVQFMQR